MKIWFAILSLFICLSCMAADGPKPVLSKQDKKFAEKELKSALDLQRAGKPEDALAAAARAAQLVPGDLEIMALNEVLRQEVVSKYLEQGNRLAAAGDSIGAMQQFQTAL